jgi:hypothetical protein
MGIKKKEHEVYFLSKIKNKKLLPIFENYFPGAQKSYINVDLEKSFQLKKLNSTVKNEPIVIVPVYIYIIYLKLKHYGFTSRTKSS